MFLILAFLFLARRYGTSAAPVASSLADPLASDAPLFTRDEFSNNCSCAVRSVWDIVWSCLTTTFTVTWVSIHPNVPWLEEKSWPVLKRRIFLMCLALLAPEMMIMWTFKQWRGAVMIRETINEARPKSCAKWTMAHAHFLQMGGFKVNYLDDDRFETDYRYRYRTERKGIEIWENVLLFDKLRELLKKQLIDFPDTTAEEIEDRSKGDALSKGVALLQITWFIFQLIARAHQHLAITEIELTTAALAGVNSIMYLFWWNKPLDVRCPIVIRTKKLERRLVRAGKVKNTGRSAERWTFPEEEFSLSNYLRNYTQSIIPTLEALLRSLLKDWIAMKNSFRNSAQAILSAVASIPESLLKAIRVLRHLIPHRAKRDVNPDIDLLQRSDSATESHFRRAIKWIWRAGDLVVSKLIFFPYLIMFIPMDQILRPRTYHSLEDYKDAKDKMHNKPALDMIFWDNGDAHWIMSMMFYSESAKQRPLVIFTALAGTAFGSIHCAAWHFDFPSPVERILWRTASLSIVGLCLFIITTSPLYTHFVWDKFWATTIRTPEYWYWWRLKKIVELHPAIIFPVTRLSLLILSLLSLRRLPPSAFDTVVWTKFIPHI